MKIEHHFDWFPSVYIDCILPSYWEVRVNRIVHLIKLYTALVGTDIAIDNDTWFSFRRSIQ